MPQVQMPDGTVVEMPEKLTPELAARLRAFQSSAAPQAPRTAAQRSIEYSHMGQDLPGAIRPALVQEDPTVDYRGVDDPKRQAVYSILNTPEERQAYLKKEYGPENVTKSSYGQDVVIINGKKVAFEPKGGLARGNLAARTAGLAGSVAPIAGTIVGGITGGIPGAALGAGAGEAVNKLTKQALGLNLQTAGETAKDIVVEGLKGGAAEGAGQALRLVGRTALAPYEPGSMLGPWKQTLPRYMEQKAELAKVLEYGYTPKTGVYAPRAGFIQAKQKVAQDVFGDSVALENKAVSERWRNALIDRVSGKGAKPDELSMSLSQKAETAVKDAEAQAGNALVNAKQVLQRAQDKITGKIGTPSANVQESLSNDIRALKEVFTEQANGAYAPIDAYVGNKAIVPTAGLKNMASQIMAKRATTTEGQAVGQQMPMLDRIRQMPDKITFAQMQELRHELGSMSEAEALTAGVSAGRAKQLAGAANTAFDDAVAQMKSRVGEYGAKNVAKAVESLRYADAFYRDGIKKFQDLTVAGIVKDASQRGFVQPEKITEYLVRPDQVSRLTQIKNMVKPETFQQVAAQHWERVLDKSTNPVTGEIEGARLVKMLQGKENEVVFGKQTEEMRNLAKQFAALGGKLDPAELKGGGIANAIQKAVEKEKNLNKLVRSDVISAIRSEGPQSVRAADYVTDPQGLVRYRQIYKTFGGGSPEVKGLREYLARRIFSTMEVPASAPAQRYTATELSGAPLKKELERYGRPHLEEVMGKEWTRDAFNFADAAEIASRQLASVPGAGLVVSGGLRTSPLSHKWLAMKYWAMGELWSKPSVIKYLSGGFKEGKVVDVMKRIGDIGTRTVIPYEMETTPKETRKTVEAIGYRASSIAERQRRKAERAAKEAVQ